MKKILFALMGLVALTFAACSDDDNGPDVPEATCSDGVQNGSETGVDCGGPDCNPCADAEEPDPQEPGEPETGEVTVSENVSEDTTWTANNIYILDGRVFVEPGATLTIEPGTIIKGGSGTGAQASVLIVSPGADIMAEGTAETPIIFTTVNDNIEVGQTSGTNLDQNTRGQWGGLIILGNAPGSFDGDVEQNQIEGVPTEENNFALYGGSDPEDNSGVLRYVSIRHGGIALSEGNEINGLTLGTVGSGTVIDNIEVVANLDDGIEFFGGTVDASNLFVWAQGDDAIDIDQAYSGTIDNVVVVLGGESDHAFEIDGPEGSLLGSFALTNATLFGNALTPDGEYADYRSNAMGTTSNVYALDFQEGKDVELDNNGVAQNWLDEMLTFEAWEIVGAGNEIFIERVETDEDTDEELEDTIIADPTFTEAAAEWATMVEAGSQTVGADVSEFSWTYSNNTAGLGF